MRKTLVIGLVVVMAVSILSGCIGDEPETTVSVRRVEPSDSGDEKTPVTPQNPPEGTPQSPPEGTPQSPPQNPPEDMPQNPPQSPPEGTPRNPPQGKPQYPPPMDLEKPTPEEEEEAIRIALEDERVQNLIQGSGYKLEAMGCSLLPDNEKTCFLLMELENGEKYTIIINLTSGIVMDIREGEMIDRSEGESDNK